MRKGREKEGGREGGGESHYNNLHASSLVSKSFLLVGHLINSFEISFLIVLYPLTCSENYSQIQTNLNVDVKHESLRLEQHSVCLIGLGSTNDVFTILA